METRSIVWIFMFVGSSVGSYIPALWGDSFLSFSSILLSAVGALAGIYIGYQVSRS